MEEEQPKKKVGAGQVRIQNVFFDLRSDTMLILLKGREVVIRNISDYPLLVGAGIEALQNFNISYKGIYWEYFAQLIRMEDLVVVEEKEEEGEDRQQRVKTVRERIERRTPKDRHTKPEFRDRNRRDDRRDNRYNNDRGRNFDRGGDRRDNHRNDRNRNDRDRNFDRGDRRNDRDRNDRNRNERSFDRRDSDKPRERRPERDSNDPLHGVRLSDMLEHLVEKHGWEGLSEKIRVRCFKEDPSIKSSLTFLRKTDWARTKVERMYLKSVEKK